MKNIAVVATSYEHFEHFKSLLLGSDATLENSVRLFYIMDIRNIFGRQYEGYVWYSNPVGGEMFDKAIDYLTSHGVKEISPEDILKQIKP